MSLYPKFDPETYLRKTEEPAANHANPAKKSCEISSLATLAGPAPLETDQAERAALVEFDGEIPCEWAEGYARLQSIPCPASITENRWFQVIDDTGRFLDSWGAKLAAFGWALPEVFGVHPVRPEVRRGGLVWHIRGCKVVAASAGRVVVETSHGNKQSIYRRTEPNAVAVWELS